jgi:phosphopentomutase
VNATLLDLMQKKDLSTCGIGKIHDLFAGEGLSCSISTSDNQDGMNKTLQALNKINRGLIITNLVDFDMLYGHRLDSRGFADALQEFDLWLPELLKKMTADDLLIITADHGCDPTTPGTNHTREYVPLLLSSEAIATPVDLGIRQCFADVGATVADNFQISLREGQSFLSELGI